MRGECDAIGGDTKAGVTRTQAALAISLRYPDIWGKSVALWNVGYALFRSDDVAGAIAVFEEILAPAHRHGALIRLCAAQTLAEIWEGCAALGRARVLYETALQLRREIGADRLGAVHGSLPQALLAVARTTGKQGEPEAALKLLDEALPLAEAMREEATALAIRTLLAQTRRVGPDRTHFRFILFNFFTDISRN